MPKIGEHLRIRTDEEIAAKKRREHTFAIIVFAIVAIVALGVAISESSPEAQKSRAEAAQRDEWNKKVEAETEKSYKLFKEAEELQKMRPLNPVEERVIRDYARKGAEQANPR